MQYIIKTIVGLSLLLLTVVSLAQSTYLPQNSKHEPFLNRLEILLQRNNDLNFGSPKPMSRRVAAEVGMYVDSLEKNGANRLTAVDKYNLQSLLMNTSEWVTGDKSAFNSKRSLFNTF